MQILILPVISVVFNFLFAWITHGMLDTVFPSMEYWDWFRVFMTLSILSFVGLGFWLVMALFSS